MKLMLIVCLLLSFTAQAQDDVPTINDLVYDAVVEGDISNSAFYDWWRVEAQAGDVLVAQMAADAGLAPLLGLLSPGGDLVARSPDGLINDVVELEYTIPEDGQFTLVTTRVGNRDGNTTGRYRLQLRRASGVDTTTRTDDYQDVVFVCEGVDGEATTAVTLNFAEDSGASPGYRVSVYGLDGFEPVLRVHLSAVDEQYCITDASALVGDTFTLPGEAAVTLTEDDLDHAAQVEIRTPDEVGQVTLTIASRSGTSGRYLAVIEGLNIAPRESDRLEVRLGPLARDTALLLYGVATGISRLDPYLELSDAEIACDDAGRRGCEDILTFDGAGVTHSTGVTVIGDRFDAGLRLEPGTPDEIGVEIGSFNNSTYGDYALVLIGELPARSVTP
ncbi:MAG: hypothetical protein H7175_13955 [Burkholderiales bacterium]|nr:hypothetical protein [Anaerolineae bacterium]